MVAGYITMIMANGCLIIFQNNSSGIITDISAVVGDVLPAGPTAMPNPRAMYGGGSNSGGLSVTAFMSQDGSWTNNNGGNYATSDQADGGVSFWDQAENLVESAYKTARNRVLVRKFGNQQAVNFELQTLPLIVIPHKSPWGARFAFGHIRMAYGKGQLLFDNKTLMTSTAGYTPVFPWDGATTP